MAKHQIKMQRISRLQIHQIKMQLKYSVLQYTVHANDTFTDKLLLSASARSQIIGRCRLAANLLAFF